MDTATREEVSQYAMLASIEGKAFEDVKFYSFSRLSRSGRVDTPRALFGNSALIRKASSHFDFVLIGKGFSESGITNMDAPYPSSRPPVTEDYDYVSDSDLEEELLESDDEDSSETLIFKDSIGSLHTLSTTAKRGKDQSSGLEDTDGGAGEIDGTTEKRDPPVQDQTKEGNLTRQGRVVFIEDIAYRTWKAFVFYAYSGRLSFASLKSQERARPDISKRNQKDFFEPPPCSPKSMYRLAEKYGIDSLKEEALKDIQSKLSPRNILTELFSSFTLLHPGVQEIEIEYLRDHIRDPSIIERLPTWFQYLEDGELPRGAASVLASVLVKVVASRPCPNKCNSTTSMYCSSCRKPY
ncbi:hypothetical protein BD311DRAFT_660992 [Dichomitus squalens]|uniref:BTB domain-containing protein n=1 Tax=Dichomitus squalens TaxID=114155 RepID=A0A4Q9MTL9_9APHY|nr:hypothetical protein BD311DRAFT_660992 [Dichomitus squalens]